MQNQTKLTLSLALGGAILVSAEAHSAAFMLQEQSARASGKAYAGEAASPEDASTIFYNPAGMTELKRPEVQVGAYVMAPNAEIKNRGSNVSVFGNPATSFVGKDDQGFDPQAFGNLYLAAPASQGLWLGLGVTVPFGLAAHYDSDYFGRYDTTRANVRAIDIAPSIAYAIHPKVSIGGGVDVQYFDGKLVNALPNPFDPSGAPTPATDGRLALEGSDWSVGYNVGVLVKPVDKVRVGLTYRSAITHKLEGDATTTFLGATTVQAFSTDIKLPDTTQLGVAYDLTPTVTLYGQVNYYGWSRFKELRFKFADGTEATVQENFRDSWGASIGAAARVAPGWTVRGGLAYDQSPTRDNESRSTAIPDVDRVWVALGASYDFNESLTLDISYEHMFENSGTINRTNSFPTLATTVQTRGETETSSDVLGITLRMKF